MDQDIIIPGIASDGSLYPIEKMEAHRQGALHTAVSIFVFSGRHLLLQRRADTKYHSGGLWANTCCTHPNWGEDIATSARRRLTEELGLDVGELSLGGVIEYKAEVADNFWEHERVQIFFKRMDGERPVPAPVPDEVSETQWVALEDLQQHVRSAPASYAPWFRIYVQKWDQLGLPSLTPDHVS